MKWEWRSSRTVVLALAMAAFVLFCVTPVAYMIGTALAGVRGNQIGATLLLDVRQRSLLYNTALLGVGTAILSTLIGAPLGFALARIPIRFKPALRLALAAPALWPPYVVAVAWTLFAPGEWTFSLAGAVVVLALVFYPLSMLTTEVAVRRVEPRLEEAALLVARPGRVLTRITLPLVAPSTVAAALVILVLAVSEFGVPGVLRVRVFTTEIFTAFAALYDFGRATVLALPLMLLCVAIAAIAAALGGERVLTTKRRLDGRSALQLAAWRRPALALAISAIGAAVILPCAVLARDALRTSSVLSVIEGSQSAVITSLVIAAIAATIATAIAVCLGYARARARRRAGVATDILMIVLFAVPSTVLGIGLIGVWNRPGVLGAVYATPVMLVLASLGRFVPVATLAIAAALRAVPTSHEEAAAVGGARTPLPSWRTRCRHG
ncbi:MAG TPA: ABC transporter permease subunit [Vicinamibacterales bacterium]|nr:ABC transporter permease subunit [Vicinamibacterales bacterium]